MRFPRLCGMIKKRKGHQAMYRIYLVEDDRVIAKTIADKLTAWNFTVKCTQDFSSILGELWNSSPTLSSWISRCRFQWVPLVSGNSQGFPSSDPFPVLGGGNINIVMAINMGQTTLLQSLLTSRCCWQKSRRPFAGHMTIKAESFAGTQRCAVQQSGMFRDL